MSSEAEAPENVPVFVLCGGFGTRLREQTEFRPKPMIPVGGRPILWHIMRSYAHHGFRRFVLCLGYKAEVIKEYFLNYSSMNSDFTVNLKSDEVQVHSVDHEDDWDVTLAYTGDATQTGARVAKAAQRYMNGAEHFAVTYGDGLTDVNLAREFEFHKNHGKVGTILGVNPPSRFGEIKLDGDTVQRFEEKPDLSSSWVNGGYFFFHKRFLDYLSTADDCTLEKTPLVNLAGDGQLQMYKHDSFWQCMDTQRDADYLNKLWGSCEAPWRV